MSKCDSCDHQGDDCQADEELQGGLGAIEQHLAARK